MNRTRVALVFGTRPEAVKLAPVHAALMRRGDKFETRVIVTGQHREMLQQMLDAFGVVPDVNLAIMQEGQSLAEITCRALTGLQAVFHDERPDVILVQGDTTTVFAGALAAFYERVAVGHVEAGLRTSDKFSPYPEEINRRLTAPLADMHFAATRRARRNLLAENVDPQSIFVTGNTVVDALQTVASSGRSLQGTDFGWVDDLEGRLVLVTAHRRENLGVPLARVCEAIQRIVERYSDVTVLWPLHFNPLVRKTAHELLDNVPRVRLAEPPDYLDFVPLMQRADLIITDSGGVQEEAPALGVPVLVVRDTTERPEGVEAGIARLVGTDADAIFEAAAALFENPSEYRRMAEGGCPYGDGRASERNCDALESWFDQRAERPADFDWTAGG